MGFFDKLKKINIFASFGSELTDDFYDELEESLILADTGMDTTLELVEELRRRVREERIKTVEEARTCMCRCIADAMQVGDPALDLSTKPSVVLFIGVNGVGKTTTIGKLAARMKGEGRRVLMAAADTFRAAAADQLEIWSERSGVELVRQYEGADPAAVVFDALSAAKARSDFSVSGGARHAMPQSAVSSRGVGIRRPGRLCSLHRASMAMAAAVVWNVTTSFRVLGLIPPAPLPPGSPCRSHVPC